MHSFICGNFFIYIFDKGVAICTLYGTLINKLYATGHLPSTFSPNMFDSKGRDASIFILGIGTLLLYLWGDFHFYWTHRMLHTQWFYKSVHKIHHESYNPDPFSGKYFIKRVLQSSALLIRILALGILMPTAFLKGIPTWEIWKIGPFQWKKQIYSKIL